MGDDQHSPQDPAASAAPASAPARHRGLSWKRLALLVALLNLPLLYHGCDGGTTYQTLGSGAPCVELAFASEGFWPDRVRCLPAGLWFANLFLLAAPLWLIAHSSERGRKVLASRRLLVALAITIALTNSCLYYPLLWRYAVWNADMYVSAGVQWLILGDLTQASAENRVDFAVGSRLTFFAMLAAAYLLLAAAGWLYRRYVAVDPRRWWQWRLGGLIAAMLVLGCGLGWLLRLLLHRG